MQLLKIINYSWVKLISELIEWNEKMLFYPKLKKFYNDNLSWNNINVIDVGANKGQTIKFILSIRPSTTVYSFEPNRKLFDLLKKKYASNAKIKLFSKGVSDKPGELIFRENLLNETSTLEEIDLNSKYVTKKARVLGVKKEQLIVDQYKIQVTTLADFIAENPGKIFELLKIDVEGHELSCLKGLFASNVSPVPINYIQFEYHYDDMYLNRNKKEDLEIILTDNNFIKVKEIKHGFGDFVELIYKNTAL